MSEVQLYQRQQLPPSRVGAVKARRYQREADVPEMGVGEVIAGFAGDVFDKIWGMQAANEESEIIGGSKTLLANFETELAANPGLSPEELKKLKDTVITSWKKLGKIATLPKSKRYWNNFRLENMGNIEAQLNTTIEEIKTQQELGRSKINHDMLVAAKNSAGLTKLYFGTETEPQGLSGTLFDLETAIVMHAAGQAEINELQAKVDAEEAKAAKAAAISSLETRLTGIAASKGWEVAIATLSKPETVQELKAARFDFKEIDAALTHLESFAKNSMALEDEQLETQREVDRDVVSKAIQSADSNVLTTIDNSSLDEAEQYTWGQRARAEADRRSKGIDIVTDPEVRSNLYSGIFEVLTGAKTKKQVLDEAKAARFPGMDKDGKPIPPKLDDNEYQSFEKAINAQYEEAYKFNMGKVSKFAEGTLLNPDSLGYIKNAPIRYKILGDFNKAWLDWIRIQGDKLKITDIYPEGIKMAAMFQISDAEAEEQEIEMNKMLEAREATEKERATEEARMAGLKKVAKPGFLGRKESEFPEGFPPKKAEKPSEITPEEKSKYKDVDVSVKPKDRAEFLDVLGHLHRTNEKKAKEYYNKWVREYEWTWYGP